MSKHARRSMYDALGVSREDANDANALKRSANGSRMMNDECDGRIGIGGLTTARDDQGV